MKLKKIVAALSTIALSTTMMVSTAVVADAAPVEGLSVSLEFAGYETKGTATFAKINVNVNAPQTLKPYKMVEADWIETYEDTYEGYALQASGIDIPVVEGLQYVASLSKVDSPYTAQQGSTALRLYYANTGSYDTYYSGELNKTFATLYYRITGDVNGTYNLSIADATMGFAYWDDGQTSSTPKTLGYTLSDFTVSGCVVKPAGGEGDDDTAEKMNDGVLVASGLHAGKTSATTSVYAGASVTSIKVKDSDGKEQTASLPTLLGQGYANIMTVILYNANEMAGKTFNVEYFADEEVVKTYTYKVPSSN